MIEVIQDSVHKAKKEYTDDAWDYIQEWISDGCPIQLGRYNNSPRGHLTMSEARYLVQVRNKTIKPHKILPGQMYRRQFNKYEGSAYVFRTKEEFYQLCVKYNLWPEL